MNLIVVKDYDAMSIAAAKYVADTVNSKPDLVFCLPAGGSPIGMYKELIRMYKNKEVDFSKMVTMDMDEYVGVGSEDKNSYSYFLHDHFLNHVNVKKENIHVPNGLAEDIDKECERYNQLMDRVGPLGLAISGIGDNGHIAFNEPGEYLIPRFHPVDLAETTIQANARFFHSIDEVPRKAMSAGIADIMMCKRVLILASGTKKKDVIAKLFKNEIVTTQFPVSMLRLHADTTYIIDEEAASLL